MLPNPEQVGKLNVYRNAEAEELAGLHPADRLMVKLIQIDRLGPRIQGMLYKSRFEEAYTALEDDARKVTEAGQSLLNATAFKELLSVSTIQYIN
jgi:cytokinesis protein